MRQEFLLVGPLAHPKLCDALGLSGQRRDISGVLLGGERAGIVHDDWPRLSEGQGRLAGLHVQGNPALDRYLAVMGLKPVQYGERLLLGIQTQSGDDQRWDGARWMPELAAELAKLILDEPPEREAQDIRARLPMMGVWAESRLRAAASPPSGKPLVSQRAPEDVRWIEKRREFSGFFAVEKCQLSHRTHAGGFTPAMTREGFIMGDAVVVLPWDPVRDRVLVVEQFRVAPALRRDPQPWLLEAIAGRVDAGETVEDAARREAREEADLALARLFPVVHHYPSPGAITEFLYNFIGIAELPDGIEGVHGLDGEQEDIRGHLLDRADLMRMVFDNQIVNGPLVLLALWLEHRAEQLRAELGKTG